MSEELVSKLIPEETSAAPLIEKEKVFKSPPLKKVSEEPILPVLDYTPPENAQVPEEKTWWFEILKQGVILGEVQWTTKKTFITVGRLPHCDISLDHPSISRYHCILQCMHPNQCFLYDVSVHGTFLNKKCIPKSTYVPIYDGDFISFGASSRFFVVHGVTHPQVKAMELSMEPLPTKPPLEVTWGMGDQDELEQEMEFQSKQLKATNEEKEPNAIENDDELLNYANRKRKLLRSNVDSKDPTHAFYFHEPKKILHAWVTRKGLKLQTEKKQLSDQAFYVRLKIHLTKLKEPSEFDFDKPKKMLVSEGTSLNSLNESEVRAMLDMLKQLDELDELNETMLAYEKSRLKTLLEDLDEDREKDEYYDRSRRSIPSTSSSSSASSSSNSFSSHKRPKVETYESLQRQLSDALQQQKECTLKLTQLQDQLNSNGTQEKEEDEEDSLDAYIQGLEKQQQTTQFNSLQQKFNELTQTIAQLEKYIALVKPSSLVTQSSNVTKVSTTSSMSSSSSSSSSSTTQESSLNSPKSILYKNDTSNASNMSALKPDLVIPSNFISSEVPLHLKKTNSPLLSSSTVSSSSSIPRISVDTLNKTVLEKEVDQGISNEIEIEEDVIEWLPPKNQTGDGKTSLNDRYGY